MVANAAKNVGKACRTLLCSMIPRSCHSPRMMEVYDYHNGALVTADMARHFVGRPHVEGGKLGEIYSLEWL